jgi:uncharacterized DUF497 family protein
MGLTFEWDEQKADANIDKHGVGFQEAITAFFDPFSQTIHDPDHSVSEDRFILLGRTSRGRLVVAIHVERGDNIRMISARLATRAERRDYHQR